jgi:hypothetical protein
MDEVLREALTKPLRALRPSAVVSPVGTTALKEKRSARAG